jgi:hypothetical protein
MRGGSLLKETWIILGQVACNVASGPRPPMTTFKTKAPVSVDLRDEGSGEFLFQLPCSMHFPLDFVCDLSCLTATEDKGLFTTTNPESRRVVPTDLNGRVRVKLVYVVLEAQYQSALSQTVKRINATNKQVSRWSQQVLLLSKSQIELIMLCNNAMHLHLYPISGVL